MENSVTFRLDEEKAKLYYSQHTLAHIDCPACQVAKAAIMDESFRLKPFSEAAPLWLLNRKNKIRSGTFHGYQQYIKKLNGFFGGVVLQDIHIGMLTEYQTWRALPHPELKMRASGASYINHELNTLSQVLSHAGLWAKMADYYESLPLPKTKIGLAYEPEELEHFEQVARKKARWRVAYLCWQIGMNTGADPGEIGKLRRGDVDLNNPEFPGIHIHEGTKNDYRDRWVPLNPIAHAAMRELSEIGMKRGSSMHEHYLVPGRPRVRPAGWVGPCWDPGKPMGSWKKAFYAIRDEAAKKYPRLARVRRKDSRHHAMTIMLENPHLSEKVIEDMVGHIPGDMKERYSHIRKTAKKAAAMALFEGNRASAKKPALVENLG